jgi:hypothetical protein
MGSSSVDVRLFINPDSLPNVEGLRSWGKSKPSDSSPGQQLGSADENESKETKLGPEKPRFGDVPARLGSDWLNRFSGVGRQRAKLFRALAESSGSPLAREQAGNRPTVSRCLGHHRTSSGSPRSPLLSSDVHVPPRSLSNNSAHASRGVQSSKTTNAATRIFRIGSSSHRKSGTDRKRLANPSELIRFAPEVQ